MKKYKVLPEWGYRFLKPILVPLFKLYYNPKVKGKENIINGVPIILAGNHVHLMDQCLAIMSTKRVIHYMAKKEYFDGPFAWFFKMTGVISVDRKRRDELAIKKALGVLKLNGAIGIFPEGTRNRGLSMLLPFKYGAVSLAKKTGAYIIPFGITGDYEFRSKNLTINFGKPFKVGSDENLEEANERLKSSVLELMRENLDEETF